jgi:SAM-dependent methyltransferase
MLPADELTVEDLSTSIYRLIASGGPDPEQYAEIDRWLIAAERLLSSGHATKEQIAAVWRSVGDDFLQDTMQGFALLKPHGYSGDFEMIDRIYTQRISSKAQWRKWDIYFHSQSAPKAVRNRKAYFHSAIDSLIANDCSAVIKVLNLGSGPCRDIAEYLAARPQLNVAFDCVDQDPKAIAYAKSLIETTPHCSTVTFHQSNVVRFQPPQKYDLIWSAGLFDYLPDPVFVSLLARLRQTARSKGKIVIGNFSVSNPTRRYMELVGDWNLHHRTAAQLIELAVEAGASRESVTVTAESEGVNLFLVIEEC